MVELILMVLLGRHIGQLAASKGQTPWHWQLRMVLLWILLEFLGITLVAQLIGLTPDTEPTLRTVMLLTVPGIACGFGGYLLTRYRLEQLDA
jgi:drug/metabolite transporter (DMT)-like permease